MNRSVGFAAGGMRRELYYPVHKTGEIDDSRRHCLGSAAPLRLMAKEVRIIVHHGNGAARPTGEDVVCSGCFQDGDGVFGHALRRLDDSGIECRQATAVLCPWEGYPSTEARENLDNRRSHFRVEPIGEALHEVGDRATFQGLTVRKLCRSSARLARDGLGTGGERWPGAFSIPFARKARVGGAHCRVVRAVVPRSRCVLPV